MDDVPQIDVVIEDERWVELDALADVACDAALQELNLSGGYEICIMACDDQRIADLNAEFRGKPTPTNVLSWPTEERAAQIPGAMPDLPENPGELGDIAIAFETCEREAKEQGLEFADHCTHLLVHGTLHLLGFDHENDQDAKLMEGLESRILAKLGISDPYGE